jgi:uncharacterized protein YfdQ (DUF2303 family)
VTDTTETAVIVETARLGVKPHEAEPGAIYLVAQADGSTEIIDLTGDEYSDGLPARKIGRASVDDVASFAQYFGKHHDDDSEVFADLDAATVTAVLDAHTAIDARWQQHRAVLAMRKTPQWLTWTAKDRQLMRQADFAEFLEDNAADIAKDGPVSAADLLEIAQQFQAHTKVSFSSGKRLASGETQFTYSEQVEAKAGERGIIAIPSEFELGIRPLEDCDGYRVKARFRYRIADGALLLGYHLDDPAGKFRDAVTQVVEKAEEACSVTIMRGRPGG